MLSKPKKFIKVIKDILAFFFFSRVFLDLRVPAVHRLGAADLGGGAGVAGPGGVDILSKL